MRIGLDYRPAMGPAAGIGRYVRGLAAELATRCDLQLYGYFRKGNRRSVRTAPPRATLHARAVPSRVMALAARSGLYTTERALGGCALFHHTNFWLTPVRVPQVITLHDLAFLRAPWSHPPRARAALERVVRKAADRCAAVLVPSEATARDCRELLGIDRVFVTPLGVDATWFGLAPDAAPASRPYVLAVGTLEPRKNFARLIDACRGMDVDLRIAGKQGWLCDDLLAQAAVAPHVILEGRVDEARLRTLVAGASVVAYPSLLEGFGLPVLEALAAGKPVLTSDREPMRSVAGDAALVVDPEDVDAMAAGVARLLSDTALRQRLIAAGPRRAREFPWSRCADATVAAYDAVLS